MLRSLQRQRNLATLSLVQAVTDLWRQELEQYQSVRSLEILLVSVSVQKQRNIKTYFRYSGFADEERQVSSDVRVGELIVDVDIVVIVDVVVVVVVVVVDVVVVDVFVVLVVGNTVSFSSVVIKGLSVVVSPKSKS